MKNIEFKILSEYEINSIPPKSISLNNKVLCFNNLNEWIIIELEQFLKTPIIWTKIYQDNKALDASIVVCPRTLRSSVFEGKLKFSQYDDERLILEKEDKTLVPIDLNISIDINSELEPNKRYQIYIQTLRNALVDYYDIKYLHPINKKSDKYIINKNYLSNTLNDFDEEIDEEFDYHKLTYHPKTLVHIIQYTSKSGERKISIIIGKDSNNIDIKGYDNKKSGYDDYLLKFSDDIIKKECFIMPILYYKAMQIYKYAKIIIL
jgi:hypothetical protein